MREPRWSWLLTAGLMLASAVATAWSTYLYWLPCRGSMLEGTLIKPIRDDGGSYEDFQKLDPAVKAKMFACEARMDGDVAGWRRGRTNCGSSRWCSLGWRGLLSFSGCGGSSGRGHLPHFPV